MATRLVFGPAPPQSAPPTTNGSQAIASAVSRYMNRALDDGVTVTETPEQVEMEFRQHQWGTFTVERHDGTHEISINRDHVRMVRPGDASSWAPEPAAETVEE